MRAGKEVELVNGALEVETGITLSATLSIVRWHTGDDASSDEISLQAEGHPLLLNGMGLGVGKSGSLHMTMDPLHTPVLFFT